MASPFGKPSKDEVFDFEIPEGSDGLVPDGKYEVKCVGLTAGTSQAQNPMWTFNFVVAKGQFAGFDAPVFCALTQAAMWKLQETLEALGLVSEDRRVHFTKKEVQGRLAMATFITDTYKGRKRSVIASLEPHPRGAGYKPKGSTGNPFTDTSEEEEDQEAEAVDPDEAEEYQEGEEQGEETLEEGEEAAEEEEAPPPPKKKPAAAAFRPAARPAAPAPPAPRKTPAAPARPGRR